MPRFQHVRTRSIVDVDDTTAAGLGPEWKPVEAAKAPAKRTTARARTKETADDAGSADHAD